MTTPHSPPFFFPKFLYTFFPGAYHALAFCLVPSPSVMTAMAMGNGLECTRYTGKRQTPLDGEHQDQPLIRFRYQRSKIQSSMQWKVAQRHKHTTMGKMREGIRLLAWRGAWLLLAFSTDAFTLPRSQHSMKRARPVCSDSAMPLTSIGIATPRTEIRETMVRSIDNEQCSHNNSRERF